MRVVMAPHAVAVAAGVKGIVFSVARADGASTAGDVNLSVDYSSFADAFGGSYASRLRLVELPACALTTPQVAACRAETPLASADDVRASMLGADVALPAAQAVVIAAASGSSGSGGDFTATSLSEAGTWQEAGSSGAFTYSYPISVPPVPGGLEPQVGLSYNSQSVDGLTSSTNDQASWIGDGWDYSPGYVERDYQSCETEPPNSTDWVKSGDLCLSSNDATTLSLNGVSTTLVLDGSTGTWRAEADGNEKVQYLSGAGNGSNGGAYWEVAEPDGTSYYFGEDELPGWASGDTSTNSAWNVPVYEYQSGDACYSQKVCNLPWRWNLDYVTDTHGDAIAYFYGNETNYYAQDNGSTAPAGSAYTQGGALSSIEYGLRAGSIYSSGKLVTPAAEVTFTTDANRTDVPTDLACSSGATCNVQSPTFWDKYELDTIATSTLEGTSLSSIDKLALVHTYPSTGDPTTPSSLWLSSVTRTGEDGTVVSLPPVQFTGAPLPNRVMTSADLNDGYSIITRLRLTDVTNETGGVTAVTYSSPDVAPCDVGGSDFPAPDDNTDLCYPAYWTPPGASSPTLDWFNKYVVDQVSEEDTTGDAPTVVTNYSYAGAAWHYDDDSLTRSAQRTWDEWRGFQTVTVKEGASPDPITDTVYTYLQGMNGDYQANGSTAAVTLTSSQGQQATDFDQFQGMLFEAITYDGPGGAEVSDRSASPGRPRRPPRSPSRRRFRRCRRS